jgi:predicted dehydrogenase
MRALVVGCGSIGKRHLGNLKTLSAAELAGVEPDGLRRESTSKELGIPVHESLKEALQRGADVVFVTAPTAFHVPIALEAARAGCHVFIEKPLSDTLEGVDELLAEAACRGRIIYVGYNLRFHAGLRRLKQRLDEAVIGRTMNIRAEFGQYLPDWRPAQDYRQSYTAHAAMGGGIILDASHELDYVRWLCGEIESVSCSAGKLSGLEMNTEDMAEITLRIKGNVIAQVHLDCLQRDYVRTCKVVGEKGTLIWDFKQGVRHYDAATARWQDEAIAPDLNDMYVEEMRHFMSCARGEASPLVDGVTGKRVLEIALAAKKSSLERCEARL